jgi:hypothetical protein
MSKQRVPRRPHLKLQCPRDIEGDVASPNR